jgi:cardiolipin synthase
MRIVTVIARWLYHYLVPAGVRIFEYCERPLHAKVAVVDRRWVTVGSSNLDPLSLSLNLEANVLIDHEPFAAELRGRLCALMRDGCRRVTQDRVPRRTWWRVLTSWGVFHFLRHFPRWAGWLPAHRARIEPATPAGEFPPHDRHVLR